MKLVDVESERVVQRDNVLEFFSLPNFLEVIVNQKEEAQGSSAAKQKQRERSNSQTSVSDMVDERSLSYNFFDELTGDLDETGRESIFSLNRDTLIGQ